MRLTGGTLKNHSLIAPKGAATRPTSEKLRQAVFNILQHQIEESQFLDLFAGSGAMGIEALSRGASHATFIEKHPAVLRCLRHNLANLNLLSRSTILATDALVALKKLAKKKVVFDLIYIDPPYKEETLQQEILFFLDASALLHSNGLIFVEVASNTTLPELECLTLEKKRKVGSSHLFQYRKQLQT